MTPGAPQAPAHLEPSAGSTAFSAGPDAPAPRHATPQDSAAEPAEPPRKPAEVPVGGRAAARLERRAAEAARKKTGRRSVAPASTAAPAQHGPGRDAEPADPARRAPRRVVQGVVATVIIAAGVLGFWSFTSPGTEETSAQTPATSSAPPPATAPAAGPAPESVAPTVEVITPAPVGPVRVPITVLNSTKINGLAGDVGDQFTAGGWQVVGTGASPVADVATTTVYYTEGDIRQQQAATQLVEQYPDVSGPAPRYFDVSGQDTPGLVVVVTGNWRP